MEAHQDASGAGARVLVVDDEPDIRKMVAFNLERAGFEVRSVESGGHALEAALAWRPHVVVLDLMLPDVPGVEVCRQLRARTELEAMGILMLTARGDEYDRLLGFEVGTDDYVVKPFSPRELVHRVRALARRTSAPPTRAKLRWRELRIDLQSHRAMWGEEELNLRPLEFRLLCLFLENPDEVLTRSQLLEQVWGISAHVNTRTVDTHVRRLREALGEAADAIETVYGVGYRLRQP
jgi:two-component system, OmpR family, phosphate regulon response regulator PhoB